MEDQVNAPTGNTVGATPAGAVGAVDPSLAEIINAVAAQKIGIYHEFCERDDLAQEMWEYAYGPGKAKLLRLLEQEDWARVAKDFATVAKAYGERQKALSLGYEVDDLAWYSPTVIYALMPLVLDGAWDGLGGVAEDGTEGRKAANKRESFTLPVMVVDVRRAIQRLDLPPHHDAYDQETDAGLRRLNQIGDFLGGDYPGSPAVGRGRRVLSNAAAAQEVE